MWLPISHALLSFVLLFGFTHSLASGVHKWVDKDGNVHFSDRSRPGKSKQIRLRTAPSSSTTKSEKQDRRLKQQRLLDAFAKERKEKHNQALTAKYKAKERRNKCALSKDYLRSLEASGAVYNLDDQGERVFLSDGEKRKALKMARERKNKWCE